MEIQLSLLDQTETYFLQEQIKVLDKRTELTHQRSENVRRGLFARHNELVKADQDIMQMLECIQKELAWIKRVVEEKHESDIIALSEKVM